MIFDVSIKNFGKIKNANIKIRPFTVIGGKNSSGKSFTTRALYSFFSTINKDHVTLQTLSLVERIDSFSSVIYGNLTRPSAKELELLNSFQQKVNILRKNIELAFKQSTYTDQVSHTLLLQNEILEIESAFDNFLQEVKSKKKFTNIEGYTDITSINLKNLKEMFDQTNKRMAKAIESDFNLALKENFQVQNLNELKNHFSSDDSRVSFDFEQLGSISIIDNSIHFTLQAHSIDEFQKLYNVVYIESPIYWKIKDSLEVAKKESDLRKFRFGGHQKKEYLSGVPKYFYDLLELIENKIQIDTDSKDCFDNSIITDSINGKIQISNTGELSFLEKNSPKAISLNSTATGITNLGIIALLMERKVIAKGSYLFIDEPEANLHPRWQKLLVEVLYDLSLKGINIVIASHSNDMMKCIELLMDKHEIENSETPDSEHFGINFMSREGNSLFESENNSRILSEIQKDLSEPFAEMYMESLI